MRTPAVPPARRPSPRLLAAAWVLVLASAAAAPAAAEDPPKREAWEYPREFSAAGRKMTVAEPVLLSRDAATGDVRLRFAAQMIDGAGRLWWGAIEATGRSHLDLASRLVLVDGIAPAAVTLPQLAEKDREEIAAAVPEAFPKELTLRLEILTAGPGAAPPEPATPPKLTVSAPEILVRKTPAVLLQTDGEPVKDTVADFPIEYVVNTAADLFRDPKSSTWHLLVDGAWIESKELHGEWKASAQPPIVLSQLPITHPRGHVRLFVPGTPEHAQRNAGKKPAAAAPAPVPEVIVRDKPAELVLLEGDPLFMMVPKVKLMVVANTESDLLYHPKSALFFLLLSGRWYQAEDVTGPWAEAFGSLPAEFAQIPRDHVRAHVLACVPGTPEAAEAAALAALEERATLVKGTSVSIQYADKELRKVPVEGTPLALVVNSDDDVLYADKAYWCCAHGTWFRSDDGRLGWTLATEIPAALAQVPEGSGAYQTTGCAPRGVDEGGVVTGVTGAYHGVFLWKGAPVHGTGYTRRGLLRNGNWYPYPRTFGENRWYDPIAGVFQARTVRYDAEMAPVAAEWSAYTASYGRVRKFASRYDQGGRRMFPFTAESGRFDVSAPRPDVFDAWGTQLRLREGLKPDRFPLGVRSWTAPAGEPAVVADAAGAVWRLGAKGLETWKDTQWVPGEGIGAPEKAWLETFARLASRPAELRSWAEKRRAPLPVNPTVTR